MTLAEATGCWPHMKSPRWARTSLRRVSPMHITVSMWAAAPSCTTPPLPNTGTGDRWKRLLSRASLTDTPYGSEPDGPTDCKLRRSCGRARSRLGENRYRFFSNNCEHFSEWCVNGEHRSPQVERLLAPLRCVPRALTDLLRLLKATPLRGGDCGSRGPLSNGCRLHICAGEQRAEAPGADCSLFADQPNAGFIRAAHRRECRQGHAHHHRRLVHSEPFAARAA